MGIADTGIVRDENWPKILDALLLEYREKPFEWGSNDCCLFAANVVLAYTGIDMGVRWRGKYDSKDSLEELLQGMTVEEIMEQVAEDYNLPEIKPLQASRGDVVILESELGPALGIVTGAQSACTGHDGIAFRNNRHIKRAWKI
jgi:hypothetical protein